ncbi:hypothetical protein EYB25_003201 [Talaromyces marneffei]|nr:hypothetical protein EYB25_003201 [Talaromyces marneffei]
MHHSEFHKYDAALYQLLNYMHSDETDVTLKPPLRQRDTREIHKDLYYRRVISWWNKSKALHDIYIKNDAYMATLSFIDSEDLNWTILSLYSQARIPDEFASSLPKGKRLRPISKGRFYRAVMGRFLDAKALQFSRLFPDYEESRQWQDSLAATWSNYHLRSFRESLEILEIFDFTYFLLSNALRVGMIPEIGNDIPRVIFHWAIAIEHLQAALTPFDILSLLASPSTLSESRYLSELFSQAKFLGMCEAEDDVAHKLKLENSSIQWRLYRGFRWRLAVRGRCFSDSFDEERVAHDIRQFELDEQYRRRPEQEQPELRYWWQDLYQSSNHEENAALSASFPENSALSVNFRETWVIEDGSSQAEVFAVLNAFEEYYVA